MELGKSEVSETGGESFELGFDPDKLIDGDAGKSDAPEESDTPEAGVNPETVLHDPRQLATPVEGLKQTRQDYEQIENGNTIYDHPSETGKKLNSNQGEAVEGVMGDCGLVSAENICALAEKEPKPSEADVVSIAINNGLCDFNPDDNPSNNGAANAKQIRDVLGVLGIDSEVKIAPSINEVVNDVESGRGVIAGVDTSKFWNDYPYKEGHAVTLTSVERDLDGSVVAFYVCDSGEDGDSGCKRVDASRLESSLMETVVTTDPIR